MTQLLLNWTRKNWFYIYSERFARSAWPGRYARSAVEYIDLVGFVENHNTSPYSSQDA